LDKSGGMEIQQGEKSIKIDREKFTVEIEGK
jgi:hypothetical protein